MKRPWAMGIVLVAVLAVIAYVAWPHSSDKTGNQASAENFVLPRLEGTGTVRLSQFRGKPVFVDLFASWCTACQDELPILSAEQKHLHNAVIFVGVDSQDTGDGVAMAKKYGIFGWPLASDIGATQSDYHDQLGQQGMPVAAFYSRTGKLIATDGFALTQGELTEKLQQYFGVS